MADKSDYATVPLDALLPADSPRLEGEDQHHIRTLAQVDTALPPILVHRPTMRVIDGMHRLAAARLRGEREIRVRFVDDDQADLFVTAVAANIAHGLPLSLADRAAAARRILGAHWHWSDRKVAAISGLSARSVGVLRQGMDAPGESDLRTGRDGRVRRRHGGAAARERAAEVMSERPGASIREVAREVGISPATASDVRARLRDRLDPVPPQLRARELVSVPAIAVRGDPVRPGIPSPRDANSMLRALSLDPSVRFNDDGRALLRWLHLHIAKTEEWRQFADTIPEHCLRTVAELAREASRSWWDFAEHVERTTKHGRSADDCADPMAEGCSTADICG